MTIDDINAEDREPVPSRGPDEDDASFAAAIDDFIGAVGRELDVGTLRQAMTERDATGC